MQALIIRQNGITGDYHLISGKVDPSKEYELHNGRYFGFNSMDWVDSYNKSCKTNEGRENPPLKIKGSKILA